MLSARVKDLCQSPSGTVKDALLKLDQTGEGIVLVVDDNLKLLGILTDGDYRRAILRGVDVTKAPVTEVMNTKFICGKPEDTRSSLKNLFEKHKIRHLPIVSESLELLDLIFTDTVFEKARETEVILMVGGKGTRLGDLTKSTPKPMLDMGGAPLLERIVKKFTADHFVNFTFCVNYQSHVIEEYFGDGSKFGIRVKYTKEDMPLGTAGALSLLNERPSSPFIVMNGDLLTEVNFSKMLEFHSEQKNRLTLGVRNYKVAIPFGVVEHDKGRVQGIVEKPSYAYYTNAGIYVLDPDCIDQIPRNEYYHMTSLVEDLIKKEQSVRTYSIHENWVDIGYPKDYWETRKNFTE